MKTPSVMNVYKEDPDVIFLAQNKDPFFDYLTEKIFAEVDSRKGGRVLDLGCGSGRNVFFAAKRGFSAVGLDSVEKATGIANARAEKEGVAGRVQFVTGNLMDLAPQQFGLFDYCILSEVIEHLDDYQKILDFAYASLNSGGKLLLTTPNDPGQWSKLDDAAKHVRRFTLEELRGALSPYRKIKMYTIGFPFQRLFIALYDFLLKIGKRDHQPRSFRATPLVMFLHYRFGSLVMAIDDLFRFTRRGTTIIAIAEK